MDTKSRYATAIIIYNVGFKGRSSPRAHGGVASRGECSAGCKPDLARYPLLYDLIPAPINGGFKESKAKDLLALVATESPRPFSEMGIFQSPCEINGSLD